jgi:hypothetical protein
MAAQDLTPRAYVITPVRSNAVIFSYVYNTGEILLDPTVPIEDLNAQIHVPLVSFYHSFNFFSRSANVAVAVPYGYGHFRGIVLGDDTRITRSGLADSRIRLSVNLHGGQAMTSDDTAAVCEAQGAPYHRRERDSDNAGRPV